MGGCTRFRAWLRRPAVRFLWLAPLLHQVLTGAKSPGEFLTPSNLLVALVVYGCGGLVVHDLALRWRGQAEGSLYWPRLLWLGTAYGVLVDGVMLGSYTSLDWSRLGRLADPGHGHILGLNLTWSVIALAHHVALAVTAPILLIELTDPESRGRPWLTPRRLRVYNGLFWMAVVFGGLAQQMRGSWSAYGFVCLLALLMWRRARWWAPRPVRQPSYRLTRWLAVHGPHRPWRVWLGCALLTLALLLVVDLAPKDPPDGIKVFRVWRIFLLTTLALSLFTRRLSRRITFGWSDRHTLAALAGPLLVYAVLDIPAAWDTYHGEYPGGQALVGLVVMARLAWLWRASRIKPPPVTETLPEPEL